MQKIQILEDRVVHDGKYIKLIETRYKGITGEEGVWERVERKTHGRIVAIAAVTKKRELVLIKIFRIPLRAYTIELPAGLMDKKGVSEETLARAELLQETGYDAPRYELINAGPFNSGLVDDELAIYLALDAEKVQEQKLEEAEEIEVMLVPLSELESFLLPKDRETRTDIKLGGILPALYARGLMG
ncbi:NUDIX hydrolase [bacterium]|nr:NUDIX hydrolase [bacterium]MCI0566070.1 NUDIX hydrolase [bacterium]